MPDLTLIGAGFGRTGTTSLKRALERLGVGRCYHMEEVMNHRHHVPLWAATHRGEAAPWDEIFEGFGATVDWPAAAYWRQLAGYYPAAKVILTVRDPEAWYESFRATIFSSLSADAPSPLAQMAADLILDGVFGGRADDRAHAIDVYRRHIEEVKAALPAERLLVYDITRGWAPLCHFLGRPVPDEPFFAANARGEWKEPPRGE